MTRSPIELFWIAKNRDKNSDGFPCTGCRVEENVNFLGNDITLDNGIVFKKVETWFDCINFAAQTPGGRFWTWNENTNRNCHVKSSDSGRESVNGVKSGNVNCSPFLGW